jgi:hypothetical protein
VIADVALPFATKEVLSSSIHWIAKQKGGKVQKIARGHTQELGHLTTARENRKSLK